MPRITTAEVGLAGNTSRNRLPTPAPTASDGAKMPPGSRVLDRYTNPGRTLSASLAVSW